MTYFIKEITYDIVGVKCATGKAREDVETILLREGAIPIEMDFHTERATTNSVRRALTHIKMGNLWNNKLSILKPGDTLIIQFPPFYHTVFLGNTVRTLTRRGINVIALIHDVDMVRHENDHSFSWRTKFRIHFEERGLLNLCSKIVVHNKHMLRYFLKLGFAENQLVSLNIFDYLVSDPDAKIDAKINAKKANGISESPTVAIAGNLDPIKAGYIYQLPGNVCFDLYGIHYTEAQEKTNVIYHGAFSPEELPFILTADFGLVWDGPSSQNCVGNYGRYLRYNNPHKASLYLAAGLPIAIWKEAALAEYICGAGLGIAIDSLDELHSALSKVTHKEYATMLEKVQSVGRCLRAGKNTISIEDIILPH